GIWLDPEMMSPYRMYQFWLNADDAIVVGLLKVFTFLTRAEIEELERAVAAEPFKRAAQRTLAAEVTALVHGEEALAAVVAASEA
ncbi:tyrosine--tRNA ligase, partial [Mesorhizobium japonicum]